MSPVAARVLLGLSVLALGAGATVAKSPPVDRLGVIDTLIHQIQGDGLVSPLVGSRPTTRGVVTAVVADGYFLQSLPGDVDGDPATSEGLFIHTGPADPGVAVGQEREVTGRVEEARVGDSPHQLTLTRLVDTESRLLASGAALPSARALTGADLSPAADVDALERYEGMRVSATQLVVVGATGAEIDPVAQVAESDGVVHAVWHEGFLEVTLPFREPGLSLLDAGTPPAGKSLPMHDANPEVLRIDSLAQPGAPLIDTGVETRLRDVAGVLSYRDARYTLLIDPVSPLQVQPRFRTRPAILATPGEVKLAWMDLGDLFDASDDPSLAEPVLSESEYYKRLVVIASNVCRPLANPEVIAVRGVESLQVLRDLADMIDTNPDFQCPLLPRYQPLLSESARPDGLDIGFLVAGRVVDGVQPRVEVLDTGSFAASETSPHPAGGAEPLFATPPLVARLRVTASDGRQFEFTAVNADFQSQEEADSLAPGEDGWSTRGERIMSLRARQAASLAAWLEARQQADAGEAIVVMGGFDADAFNDGRVDVLGIVTGRPAPVDQSWVSLPSPVSVPLTNLTLLADANQRYNAEQRGDRRALDHLLVNAAMRDAAAITPLSPRGNVDSPAVFRVNSGGNYSSRDPLLARLAVKAFADADTRVELANGGGALAPTLANTIALTVGNDGPDFAPVLELRVESELSAAQWSLSSADAGWTCGPTASDPAGSVATCRTPGLAAGETRSFEIRIGADPALDGVSTTFAATLGGGHDDADLSNNEASRVVTFASGVDVYIELEGRGGGDQLLPGTSAGWNVAVMRTPAEPAGPVDIIVDIDAALDEVTLNMLFSGTTCTGAATGPRSSRFTCLSPPNAFLELAIFELYFSTLPVDGGRVIGLTVEANARVSDPTPDNNRVSDSRRVLDPVDLVAIEARYTPDGVLADNSSEATVQLGVYNAISGMARNARLDIQMALPPAAIRVIETRPIGDLPDVWTCDAPQASGSGSLIACRAPPFLEYPSRSSRVDYFDIRFTAPYQPGPGSYDIPVTVSASSDSDEATPGDNVAASLLAVDQTTDLRVSGGWMTEAVSEPGTASFMLHFSNEGRNPPIDPRVKIVFDAVFPLADLSATDSEGAPVACVPVDAPAGNLAVSCPYALDRPAMRVEVRTNPSLATALLNFRATLSNERTDVGQVSKVVQDSVRVENDSDMCLGTSCSASPTPYPLLLTPDGRSTLVYDIANLGPSTSVAQVLTFYVGLPPARVSASFDGRACLSPALMADGRSLVSCPMPDVIGDGAVRRASLDVDATGLSSGTVSLDIVVEGGGRDVFPANNLLRFTLPIATFTEVDLRATVAAKPSRYPGPANFVVTAGAEGNFHMDLSRLILEIDMPFPSGPVIAAGNGWRCAGLFGIPGDPIRLQCDRLWPLASGTTSPVAITVPAARFEQIGRPIRVTARHGFAWGAGSVDSNPSNDFGTATWIVDGRRTGSVEPPAEPTPAYGQRRAIRLTPLRPQSHADALD